MKMLVGKFLLLFNLIIYSAIDISSKIIITFLFGYK